MSLHTVDIIGAGSTDLLLKGALLMYESNRGDVYATTHQIEIDATHPDRRVVGAGVPLSKGALAKFAEAVGRATAFAGFVPASLLYTSPNLIAWWTPAQVRTTWFKQAGSGTLDGHGPASHPPLVFVATPDDWFVFALRENSRPEPATRLHHAPHFNVWDGGRICTGNIELPPAPSAEAIGQYEHAFFRSHFTHPNRSNAVKHKGGMVQLWRDQLNHPDPAAMCSALIASGETLQEAITRIATRTTPR